MSFCEGKYRQAKEIPTRTQRRLVHDFVCHSHVEQLVRVSSTHVYLSTSRPKHLSPPHDSLQLQHVLGPSYVSLFTSMVAGLMI
jgi:hypothetical protein